MENNELKIAVEKCELIIDSCSSREHIKTAENYVRLIRKKYNDGDTDRHLGHLLFNKKKELKIYE